MLNNILNQIFFNFSTIIKDFGHTIVPLLKFWFNFNRFNFFLRFKILSGLDTFSDKMMLPTWC